MILVLALPGSAVASSQVLNPAGKFYVNDFAGVIDDKTENELVHYGILLHKKNGAQVVLVTVKSTNGEPIKDYASRLFDSWGIGSAQKNNGLLLLLSIDDDDYWAVQGKGIVESMSDSRMSNILSQSLEPDFAAKNYNRGAAKTYAAFVQGLGGAWGASASTGQNVRTYVSDNAGVLSAQTKAYINELSNKYRLSTGSGVYVVTVKNSGGQLQDYTYKKFNSVGAGPKDVMLVMDIEGDDYHVLQGSSIDGVLTNEAIGSILDSGLEPSFAAKNYNKGATQTLQAFYTYLLERAEGGSGTMTNGGAAIDMASAGTFTGTSSQGTSPGTSPVRTAASGTSSSASGHIGGGGILLIVLIAFLVGLGVRSSRRRSYMGQYGVPYNPYSRRSVRRYGHHHHGGFGFGAPPPPRQGGGWFQPPSGGGSNHGDGGQSSGGGAGRRSSGDGGQSSGGGAGRRSSGGSFWSSGGSQGGGSEGRSSGGSSWSSGSSQGGGGGGRSSGGSSWSSGSNHGGGGSSSGGGAGRSSGSSGGGNASGGGGVGRHR
ncbi:TPM domain-containing protein [Paenibacillus sinensis]|nr:TPM domain-containing protein [Paenibacillus sinensis]